MDVEIISIENFSYPSVDWGDFDNDNDLDLIIQGYNQNRKTKIYKNMGNNNFIEISSNLLGLNYGTVSWCDVNNNNKLDIIITGRDDNNIKHSFIYLNQDNESFLGVSNQPFEGVQNSSFDYGDYNNDGKIDVLLTGDPYSSDISVIYQNNGNGNFSSAYSFIGIARGVGKFGDYDNDGDLDVLIVNGYQNRFYENNGNASYFQVQSIILDELIYCDADWGDYNNDGYLDFAISGMDSNNNYHLNIYNNNGNKSFSKLNGLNLVGSTYGTLQWGDYDNDGDLDLLSVGSYGSYTESTHIYQNDNGTFQMASGVDIVDVVDCEAEWGDYDNDGKLDILISGKMINYDYDPTSRVYRGRTTTANTQPLIPTNLSTNISGSKVTFSWSSPTDEQTPSTGLSYNLRVGTAPGGYDIVSPMSADDGYRKIPHRGLFQTTNNSYLILPSGTYYWSVQAIDGGFMGSAFANEQSFIIP